MEINDAEYAELKANAERAAEAEKRAEEAKKYKDDMLKYKQEREEYSRRLEEIEAAKSEDEKKRLAEKEQFKTLYEKAEAEKKALAEKNESNNQTLRNFVVSKELEAAAIAAGVRKEAMPDLRLLDTTGLEVTQEGKEIRVSGARELLEAQKKQRPHWFASDNSLDFDGGKGTKPGNEKELSTAELIALRNSPKEEDRIRYREIRKKQLTNK